ncbi:MAG: hypothetical protein LBI18_16265 [Planctomycetaceae bacterium]|nr:hypothetical protein [Planctomycetaceae bacterium]
MSGHESLVSGHESFVSGAESFVSGYESFVSEAESFFSGGQPFTEGFSSTVVLPLGNLSLFTDGNLCCQTVWNPIASRKQGQIGYCYSE